MPHTPQKPSRIEEKRRKAAERIRNFGVARATSRDEGGAKGARDLVPPKKLLFRMPFASLKTSDSALQMHIVRAQPSSRVVWKQQEAE